MRLLVCRERYVQVLVLESRVLLLFLSSGECFLLWREVVAFLLIMLREFRLLSLPRCGNERQDYRLDSDGERKISKDLGDIDDANDVGDIVEANDVSDIDDAR